MVEAKGAGPPSDKLVLVTTMSLDCSWFLKRWNMKCHPLPVAVNVIDSAVYLLTFRIMEFSDARSNRYRLDTGVTSKRVILSSESSSMWRPSRPRPLLDNGLSR